MDWGAHGASRVGFGALAEAHFFFSFTEGNKDNEVLGVGLKSSFPFSSFLGLHFLRYLLLTVPLPLLCTRPHASRRWLVLGKCSSRRRPTTSSTARVWSSISTASTSSRVYAASARCSRCVVRRRRSMAPNCDVVRFCLAVTRTRAWDLGLTDDITGSNRK